MTTMNPFDLNLARAYSAADAFCPRNDVSALLQRAYSGRLWTLINGDRRLGKSSSVIVTCVQSGWPILHVDLMGVRSVEEITERFRWSWQIFQQQETRGLFSGLNAEMSATVPGTGLGVKLASAPTPDPKTWGDVIAAFDLRVARRGGVLFVDELQDVLDLPKKGTAIARSLRAALQVTRNLTPVLAGSSQHLLAPLFDTAAAPFFKSIRIHYQFGPINREVFISWISRVFQAQSREWEVAATDRLFQLTAGVTEDLVATCAEIWAQPIIGRTVSPADVDVAWRYVVNNAAPIFLPRISKLSTVQSLLLRYIARNPRCQPYAEMTLKELGEPKSTVNKALERLIDFGLVREATADRSRRVWVDDPRVAFFLQT